MDYVLHRARITEQFCVNRAKPQLHCNGKCHLRRQLRKAATEEKKAPATAHGKVKYDALLPVVLVCLVGQELPSARRIFPPLAGLPYRYEAQVGVFRPPLERPATAPAAVGLVAAGIITTQLFTS